MKKTILVIFLAIGVALLCGCTKDSPGRFTREITEMNEQLKQQQTEILNAEDVITENYITEHIIYENTITE